MKQEGLAARPALRAAGVVGFVLLAGVALCAGGARASVVGDLEQASAPSRVRALMERACDPEVPIGPDDLRELLHGRASTEASRLGARLAECRADPALAVVMWEGFLLSKASRIAFDPDVFERLLFALQDLPFPVVRSAVEAAELPEVAEACWDEVRDRWIRPMLGPDALVPELDAALAEAASAEFGRSMAALFDEMGRDALVVLQVDGGDQAGVLLAQIKTAQLATLVRGGEFAWARAAAEAALDPSFDGSRVRRAIEQRLAQGDLEPAQAAELRSYVPRLNHVLFVGAPAVDRRRQELPPRPIAAAPMLQGERPWPVLPALLGASLGLLGALVLAGRNRRARRWALPGAAMGLGLLALVALEGVVTLAGVTPRMDRRASFTVRRAIGGPLIDVRREGDETWAQATTGDARARPFAVPKPDDTTRVFVFGESSAHGTHYPAEYAFASVLEERLKQERPARRWEVLNLGIGGAVSDEIVLASYEALRFEPDLFVTYFGWNDLTLLPGVVSFESHAPWQLALRFLLDRSRLVAFIAGQLPKPRVEVPSADRGEPLGEGERLTFERLGALNAAGNLARIVRRARREGVPTLVLAQVHDHGACRGEEHTPLCKQGLLNDVARRGAVGAPIVDGDAAILADAQARGLAYPQRYFWDPVHPTIEGHRALGEVLVPAVLDLLDGG